MAEVEEHPINVLFDKQFDLAESPIWDERLRKLYFIDIHGKKIFSCDEDGSSLTTINLSKPVGSVGLTTDPDYLIASLERTVCLVNVKTQEIGNPIATLPRELCPPDIDNYRFNEGKPTPNGEFILGTLDEDFIDLKKRGRGRLLRLKLDTQGKAEFVDLLGPGKVDISNGLVWTNNELFYCDTFPKTISVFDVDEFGVPLLNGPNNYAVPKRVINITGEGFGPDGCTLTKDGDILVAYHSASQLLLLDAKTGHVKRKFKVPVSFVTSCQFGGTNLDKLYITSMLEPIADGKKQKGSLFVMKIPGLVGAEPDFKFKLPAL